MERTATIELTPVRAAGAAMLALAAVLPLLPASPTGIPCPLRSLTGIPCPLCGMTRSVGALVHGDLAGSLLLNPAGVFAVLGAVAVLAAWRWRRVSVPLWAISATLALMWAYQLFKYTTGRPL